VKAFRVVYRFLYDIIIGDDWKVAAAVVVSLSVGVILLHAGVPATVVAVSTAILIAAAFAIALIVDLGGRTKPADRP
jgi:serine acetyltransferase